MKSLKKNYIYNLVYQIISIITPFITAPYIARVLGAVNIGKYSYTQSIVAYILLVTTLGTTMYGQREIAFEQQNKQAQTKILIEIVIIRIVLGLIGCITLFFLCRYYKMYSILFAIQSIDVVSNMISIDWFYAGNEEFKTTAIRNILIRIINILGIFTFVKNEGDLFKYILIISISTFAGNSILWLNIRKHISHVSLRNLKLKKHIMGSFSVFAAQVAASIYTMLDKTMLGIITKSDLENGYYEQAQKIEKIALVFVTALGTVIMPKISKAFADDDSNSVEDAICKSFNYMWMIALPMTFGLIAIASSFIPWFYGDGYEKSIILIQILSFLIIAIGISNITGIQYLMATNKEKILTLTVLVGAVVNVLLNLILIYGLQSVGAAIASVAAETAVAVAQLIYVGRQIKIKKILSISKKYLFGSGVMFCIVILVKYTFLGKPRVLDTVILVVIGVITYLVTLMFLKEEFLLGIIKESIRKMFHKI